MLEVSSLRITTSGWWVDAEVANETPAVWTLGRGHRPAETKFGLFVKRDPAQLAPTALDDAMQTTPPLVADRFRPAAPRRLRPQERWKGSFGGVGRIPSNSYVAVVVGTLATTDPNRGKLASGLLLVSRPVRVP